MNNLETYDRVVMAGIDFENDFITGTLPVPQGEQTVAPFNEAAAWTRRQDGTVVFTRDWHPPETKHFAPEGPWPVHCVAGTEGAAFHRQLDVRSGDIILSKGTKVDEDAYSGFQGVDLRDGHTTLESLVLPKKHERVALVVGGLATDYCVKATVLDALDIAHNVNRDRNRRHLGVFVLTDAIRGVNINRGDDRRAIDEMTRRGARFITSRQLIDGQVMEVRS